ncbi:hypothetical protein FHS79_002478 [Polymorphobacter multimanifer]|uniref:Peptidase M28 domain-containing protein n=1 Tax=Polymorphobacter multimanifer TaxID=1070431 RepID=A0A841LBE4_9SPHN|nr:M28 family peptidase [Polymorphobacter multimanifer]MBB6228293.1 hypothetical protein [Polymorphobacter multimanifer]
MRKTSFLGAAAAASLLFSPGNAAEPDRLAQALEGHVRFLADDLLEGRGLGQRGHEIAARYVASQFASLGLQPAGSEGWFQRISFAERSFSSDRETMVLTRGGRKTEWLNGKDLVMSPGNVEGAETITAPLVFVGFGLRDTSLGIDDFAGIDVRGKIVVALSGAHPGMNSETAAHLARTSKAVTAVQNGAVGLIQVRTFQEQGRIPFDKVASRGRASSRSMLGPDGAPLGDGAALKVRGTLGEGAAVALFEGAPMSFQQALEAAAKGPVKGFDLPGTLTITRAQKIVRITSPNVLGLLPGADPRLAQEIVLVQAHTDHIGIKADAPPGTDNIYNGAMDNAGGTATMIETARIIASGKRPARSILFFGTTAEESGLLGADYWSRNPTLPIGRVVGVVNIDMPILSCDFGDIVAFGAERSTLIAPVTAAARGEGLTVSPDPQPEEAVFTRSDHYPMVRAGIPSVFLKTGHSDSKGGQTCGAAERDFRLNRYHELGDDLNQPFDWTAAAKFARLNTDIVRRVANGKQRPLWYAGDYFGDSFAPTAAKAKR